MKQKIKKIVGIYIETIQKIILFISLILLYIFGFGLTKIFIFIFQINLFDKKFISKNSFWEKVKDNQSKNSFYKQI